jgi:GTPase
MQHLLCFQVNILDFKERRESKHYIKAALVCETAGQQGILVGSRGSALKALASAARVDIEEFLGHGVFLDIDVQVEAGWRQDKQKVKSFGYL